MSNGVLSAAQFDNAASIGAKYGPKGGGGSQKISGPKPSSPLGKLGNPLEGAGAAEGAAAAGGEAAAAGGAAAELLPLLLL